MGADVDRYQSLATRGQGKHPEATSTPHQHPHYLQQRIPPSVCKQMDVNQIKRLALLLLILQVQISLKQGQHDRIQEADGAASLGDSEAKQTAWLKRRHSKLTCPLQFRAVYTDWLRLSGVRLSSREGFFLALPGNCKD